MTTVKARTATFVDSAWQEAARDNAKKGYPWAIWGFKQGRAGILLCSLDDLERAQSVLSWYKRLEKPGWVYILCHERGGE